MQLRTCFRFGAVSSTLVALRILIARSVSCLYASAVEMDSPASWAIVGMALAYVQTHFPMSTLREDPYSAILPVAAAFAGI
jgi:hypothetical protein